MLVDSPEPGLAVPLRALLPGVGALVAGTLFVVRLVVQSQRRRPVSGTEAMVGQRGVALDDLTPGGWVLVAGERWQARAEGSVHAGDSVIVRDIEGLHLRVGKEV